YGFLSTLNTKTPPRIIGNGLDLIPQYRPSGNGILYRIPNLDPGFYNLIHDADTSSIAVNIAKSESIMEGMSLEQLKSGFADLSHVSVSSMQDIALETSNSSFPSWKIFILVVLFLLSSEVFLHRLAR
ncbi:MAG: hypothetical protein AAF616_04860, partial [Bacteroidota bacterium]